MDPEKSGSPRVVVGLATCGIAAGAQDVYDALKNELKAQGMDYVLLEATGVWEFASLNLLWKCTFPTSLGRLMCI